MGEKLDRWIPYKQNKDISWNLTHTCVMDYESCVADGGITAEGQKEAVAAALNSLWQLGVIETSY